jgi:ketosteroid isomerase-like protein
VERAYAEEAAADVRVYRDGRLPMHGLPEAMGALSQRVRRVELAPFASGIASSRDLGYSLGLLILRKSADTTRPDTVSYLHVWRREDHGPWKLALDVENAFGRK